MWVNDFVSSVDDVLSVACVSKLVINYCQDAVVTRCVFFVCLFF